MNARTAIILLALTGCTSRSAPLPTYQGFNDRQTLRLLSQKSRAVHSASAAALLTLTRANGESVRLDGALVLSLPRKNVRLRAWKFNQAVFDLTLNSDGLWIETPRQNGQHDRAVTASLSAAQLARALSLLNGEVFDGPGVTTIDRVEKTIEVHRALAEGQTLIATVDRSTLTAREYRLTDPAGATQFTLTPSSYENFNGIVWPTRLLAHSTFGNIDVQLRDIELNAPIAPQAFVPPRGAEKAP